MPSRRRRKRKADQSTVEAPAAEKDERPPEPPDPERAFGRLAEDEALRRDLDDATFGPLLDLSANLAASLAGRFASTDSLATALRAFLAGAAEYARSGETADLAQGLGALLNKDESNAVRSSLADKGASSDKHADGDRDAGNDKDASMDKDAGNGASPEARATDLARSVARAVGLESPTA